MANWGYSKDNGPATWGKDCPISASGKKQSPINICSGDVKYSGAIAGKPLSISMVPANCKRIFNTGFQVQVAIDGSGSGLSGGPLGDNYEAAQFHFHWGRSSACGSEHQIDGKTYAAEMHLVFFNKSKYASIDQAVSQPDGLAVLGSFIKVGGANGGLQQLIDLLPSIEYRGDSIDLPSGFDASCLLPADKSKYYTYQGSLSTPPCLESIKWIVFSDPIEASEQQLQAMRQLKSYSRGAAATADEFSGQIQENFRPPCALNGRSVEASFQ